MSQNNLVEELPSFDIVFKGHDKEQKAKLVEKFLKKTASNKALSKILDQYTETVIKNEFYKQSLKQGADKMSDKRIKQLTDEGIALAKQELVLLQNILDKMDALLVKEAKKIVKE